MADTKISARTAATAATLTQEIPIVQSSTTKRLSVQLIQDLMGTYRGALAADHTINTVAGTEAFQVTIPAGSFWFKIRVIASTSAAGGTGVAPAFGINLNGGTITTLRWCFILPSTGTTGAGGTWDQVGAATGQVVDAVPGTTSGASSPILMTGGVAATDTALIGEICGFLKCSAGGDFEVYHGSETAVNTTMYAGSSVVLWKVA